ncbi:hypothetical protein [Algihabitans albus]|uniref:hypothetical protein n=1 Tax=Algihabitans albus TaxID=2164067 RepID=UPI000E5CAD7B|nr:hypothetical protein [Algihabitans albus]
MTDLARLTLKLELRRLLTEVARRRETLRYADLARAAQVPAPHTIHKTVDLLEDLMREDHAAGRPLLSALAVSRRDDATPAPGFFQLLTELGRYAGAERGPQAVAAHRAELEAAWTWWGRA